MRATVLKLDDELRKSKEDLVAAKFVPSSITGKKLVNKCRILKEENDEFGLQVSEGRIHQLQCEGRHKVENFELIVNLFFFFFWF